MELSYFSGLFGASAAKNVPDKNDNDNDDDDVAFECDYDRDCMPLFQKIEAQEWGDVSKFMESGFWPGSIFPDAFSPRQQARTWVTRFDTDDTSKVLWSQLPLHLAVIQKAPLAVIDALLRLNPTAARCSDDEYNLPLQLALRRGCPEGVVARIRAAFPQAEVTAGDATKSEKEKMTTTQTKTKQTKTSNEPTIVKQAEVQKTKVQGVHKESSGHDSRVAAQINAMLADLDEIEKHIEALEKERMELEQADKKLTHQKAVQVDNDDDEEDEDEDEDEDEEELNCLVDGGNDDPKPDTKPSSSMTELMINAARLDVINFTLEMFQRFAGLATAASSLRIKAGNGDAVVVVPAEKEEVPNMIRQLEKQKEARETAQRSTINGEAAAVVVPDEKEDVPNMIRQLEKQKKAREMAQRSTLNSEAAAVVVPDETEDVPKMIHQLEKQKKAREMAQQSVQKLDEFLAAKDNAKQDSFSNAANELFNNAAGLDAMEFITLEQFQKLMGLSIPSPQMGTLIEI